MCFLLNIKLLCDCARLVFVCSRCCCRHKCIPRYVVVVVLATSRGEAPLDDDDDNDHAGRASSSGGGRRQRWPRRISRRTALAERLGPRPRHDVFFVRVVPNRLHRLRRCRPLSSVVAIAGLPAAATAPTVVAAINRRRIPSFRRRRASSRRRRGWEAPFGLRSTRRCINHLN